MPISALVSKPAAAVVALALLASCATPRFQVPPPRVAGAPAPSTTPAPAEEPVQGPGTQPGARPSGIEQLDAPPRRSYTPASQDWSGRFPNDDQLTVAVQAMPLRELVQYTFGELLKVSYVIADGVAGLDEPVTLNVQKPVSSRALYRLVTELLAARKVGVTFKDGIFYLHSLDGQGKGRIPIGFGREPKDVPDAPGRILQVIPLRYGVSISIERTIRGLVDVEVQPDSQQSAIFVTGERQAILRVLDVVKLLDQPSTRAREVALVNLTYIGAKELADQLVVLLQNEGIPTGVGRAEGMNVALVPLEQLGALVVFASSSELRRRVEYWAQQIDRPSQGPEERYFIYHPKNARASDLGESLAPLISGEPLRQGTLARDTRSALGTRAGAEGAMGAAGSARQPGAAGTGTGGITQENALRRDAGGAAAAQTPASVRAEGLTMSVDPRSNTLIFFTTGLRYQSLLPMIGRLDVPPKQVLLEATIAEVTLTGEFAYGVEFAATEGKFSGGTEGNLGLPAGGLTVNWVGSVTDRVRAKLSASRGLVNILSNPTLVVRDGVEATIQVGNDVPTVGATASDPIESPRVITTVLYRRTGLSLNVRPTINAQGLVVMEISQSISNQVQGGSDVAGAPLFFERAVSTEVVARSGQSILLAGLISDSRNDNRSKVPGLADIPLLGALFESRTRSREKTELVVLLTPRVIENPDEWETIRQGLEGALEHLSLPPSRPSALPSPTPVQPTGERGPAP